MGLSTFEVGDRVYYKYNKSFVGRVVSVLDPFIHGAMFGIYWDKTDTYYAHPSITEVRPYHSKMCFDELVLIKEVEYPEDGSWV